MTPKKKPAGECDPQTGYVTSSVVNDKPISSRIKAMIVRLAIWGLMPIRTADCLLRRLTGGRP